MKMITFLQSQRRFIDFRFQAFSEGHTDTDGVCMIEMSMSEVKPETSWLFAIKWPMQPENLPTCHPRSYHKEVLQPVTLFHWKPLTELSGRWVLKFHCLSYKRNMESNNNPEMNPLNGVSKITWDASYPSIVR